MGSKYNLADSLTLMNLNTRKVWLKIALTVLTPSFRHVNASHWETFAGSYGPPSGGFCVSKYITIFDGGSVFMLKDYTKIERIGVITSSIGLMILAIIQLFFVIIAI